LLANPDLPLAGARVLIPGAGRGYDAATFVRAGAATAVALDVVPAAADAAAAWLAAHGLPGRTHAVCADFFSLPAIGVAAPPFDGGYDYTFFCAIPPSWRPAWGEAWGRAIKAGGWLVTLQFPLSPPDDPGRQGPPWPVTGDAYEEALTPAGFVLKRREKVPEGHSFVSADGAHSRNGREWVAVWVKE